MFTSILLGITPEQLIKAMKGEAEARLYYEKLVKMTCSPKEANIINHFIEDETKHFSKFNTLYILLTGCEPVLPPLKHPDFKCYIKGVEQAILDELEAYEFYRDIYLGTCNPWVRDIFFEALTDENEHAAHLNYIFTKNKGGNKYHQMESDSTDHEMMSSMNVENEHIPVNENDM